MRLRCIGCSTVFVLMTFFSCMALRGADFDIFPIPDSSDDEPDQKLTLFSTVSRVADVFNFAGGVYFSFQCARTLIRFVKKRNGLNKNNSTLEAIVDEMRNDQQELWRVVHKLYTTQSDKISAMSNNTDLSLKEIKADVLNLKSTVRKDIKAFSEKSALLDKIENRIISLEASYNGTVSEAKLSDWSAQLDAMSKRIQYIQNEIPTLIKQHHEVIMLKIREYIDSLRSKKKQVEP